MNSAPFHHARIESVYGMPPAGKDTARRHRVLRTSDGIVYYPSDSHADASLFRARQIARVRKHWAKR